MAAATRSGLGLVLAGWATLAVSPVLAESAPSAPAARHAVTIADILALRSLSGLDCAPDGRQAVYVVGEADVKADKRRSALWLADLAGGAPLQLTSGEDSASVSTANQNNAHSSNMNNVLSTELIHEMCYSDNETLSTILQTHIRMAQFNLLTLESPLYTALLVEEACAKRAEATRAEVRTTDGIFRGGGSMASRIGHAQNFCAEWLQNHSRNLAECTPAPNQRLAPMHEVTWKRRGAKPTTTPARL